MSSASARWAARAPGFAACSATILLNDLVGSDRNVVKALIGTFENVGVGGVEARTGKTRKATSGRSADNHTAPDSVLPIFVPSALVTSGWVSP